MRGTVGPERGKCTEAELDENTVTLLGDGNTLYEVVRGTAGPERGGWG